MTAATSFRVIDPSLCLCASVVKVVVQVEFSGGVADVAPCGARYGDLGQAGGVRRPRPTLKPVDGGRFSSQRRVYFFGALFVTLGTLKTRSPASRLLQTPPMIFSDIARAI